MAINFFIPDIGKTGPPDYEYAISFHQKCFVLELFHRKHSDILNSAQWPGSQLWCHSIYPFSYPEPFLRAVNGARQGALAKSISNWHLIGYNEGYCSNNVYILLPCFYGFRFWIWPEPLVAPRVRRALGTRMSIYHEWCNQNKRIRGKIKISHSDWIIVARTCLNTKLLCI